MSWSKVSHCPGSPGSEVWWKYSWWCYYHSSLLFHLAIFYHLHDSSTLISITTMNKLYLSASLLCSMYFTLPAWQSESHGYGTYQHTTSLSLVLYCLTLSCMKLYIPWWLMLLLLFDCISLPTLPCTPLFPLSHLRGAFIQLKKITHSMI